MLDTKLKRFFFLGVIPLILGLSLNWMLDRVDNEESAREFHESYYLKEKSMNSEETNARIREALSYPLTKWCFVNGKEISEMDTRTYHVFTYVQQRRMYESLFLYEKCERKNN